ncbi:sensor histidine kinase [Paenibacillus ginsengarvi]|uniref:histidine kinase n=1 Tax=Paenibacillus ginsengarvi TaxID=400777 RepID=A0A3B0CDS2_9BACL|nr:HAMP domain-containing sensor histidine kinase [Paenibacillus ginsengarvi]RKN82159.1 sensor histidine kinase [Paenibacillus ginsengarvi]
MLVYFAALLAAAAVLYRLYPQRETNRWAAFFLLTASLGGLAGHLREEALPLLELAVGEAATGIKMLSFAQKVLEAANHTLTPYGVLVFSLVYAERFSRQTRRRLKLLLLLPAAATCVWYTVAPERQSFFILLLLWTAPYYAYSCWLLVSSCLRERNPWRRKERLAVAVLAVPTLVAIVAFINVASVWVPDFRFFGYIAFFIAYSLIAGVAFAFAYGVLGVKVRLERDPLESAVSAVSSGTAMLNHTIKNEIAKISICAENVKETLDPHDAEAAGQLDLIVKSAEHMKQMVTRIHGQTQDIVLREEPHRLADIVQESLEKLSAKLNSCGFAVFKEFRSDPVVVCDRVHMLEVLSNITANAVEAMSERRGEGALFVLIDTTRRGVLLSLKDTGPGVPKEQLARVLEPFYTTKARQGGGNFGLGLTYCYQVMRQSGGQIELESEEGKGTTVKLWFAANKMVASARK